MQTKIIPAILSNNFKDFKQKLSKAKNFELVQIDICDAKFVNNKTVQPNELLKISSHPPLEIHLMVKEIDHYIEHFVHWNVKTIIFHFEACKNDKQVLQIIRHIKNHDVKVGLAINPKTKVSKIKKFLKSINQVLIMTVNPGKQGQKFISKTLNKVNSIRKLSSSINIEVDGGINAKTAILAKKAGANFFAIGSAIMNSKSPKKEFENIKKSLAF